MTVTSKIQIGCSTRSGALAAVLLGGPLALLGTYWDDAWHTDIGRDGLASPPHLLLYGGVLLSLAGVAAWWWHNRREARPAGSALRLALTGGAVTLLAAPVDEAWHQVLGRDAVVWSPPHLLGVAGMLCLAAGVLAGLPELLAPPARGAATPTLRRSVIRASAGSLAGALLLGGALVPVMEYEADVPQFAARWFLPALSAGLVFAFALGERLLPSRWTATRAALAYTVLRVAVVALLSTLNHSPVPVPPVMVPALAFDLTRRRPAPIRAAATVLATMLAWAAGGPWLGEGVRVAPDDLAAALPLAVVAATLLLRAAGVRGGPADRADAGATAVIAAALGAAVWLTPAAPAAAHDPGQGDVEGTVRLTAETADGVGGGGHAALRVRIPDCDASLEPVAVVARRGGRTLRGPLVAEPAHGAGCEFRGRVPLPMAGRWFVYAELRDRHGPLEAWLSVARKPGHRTNASHEVVRYRPPDSPAALPLRVGAGVPLLALALWLGARPLAFARRGDP